MMIITHFLVGAWAGRYQKTERAAYLNGLISHLVTDGIKHDDGAVHPVVQGLGLIGVAWLVGRRWGLESQVFRGGSGGALPDFEVAANLVIPGGWPRIFPAHWQVRGREG